MLLSIRDFNRAEVPVNPVKDVEYVIVRMEHAKIRVEEEEKKTCNIFPLLVVF